MLEPDLTRLRTLVGQGRGLGLRLGAFILLGQLAAAETATPPPPPAVADATITLTARSAGLGVGFVWGAGTLDYHGQRYPVRLDGFGLGAGVASVTAHGRVYHLTRVDDLNGEYIALGAGAEMGRGANRLRMRNAKGVVVDFIARGAGVQVGMGPRGITLRVGVAGGPPASTAFVLPKTLGFGQAAFGPLSLRPTLNVQLAGFAEGNAGFGGDWAAGPITRSDVSMEHSNEVGLNALLDLGQIGTLRGRVSGVFSLSGGGVDPGATSFPSFNTNAYSIEAAFLSWRSGDAFPGLGYNAIEMGYGNQNYQVFDGLLFWDGAVDCGVRGACWLGPRRAFREAGTLRLTLGDWLIEGYHLKLNDDPSTRTRVGGGRIEYAFRDRVVKAMQSGFMYFNVYESDDPSRDGLNGFYFYQDATPVPPLPDFQYTASFVAETNSAAAGNDQAYGWYVAPAYTVSQLPWSPQLSYRFASFSGGGTRTFDPLFAGVSDWGYWAQGELLGEWVLPNTNLQSHMVRLRLVPNDLLTLNLFYYKFLLASLEESFGPTPMRVGRHRLADEIDAILDIAAANWWSMTVEFTLAVPNAGFREATGGSATWVNSMLYTNFNF
jgi:hypothetical protein